MSYDPRYLAVVGRIIAQEKDSCTCEFFHKFLGKWLINGYVPDDIFDVYVSYKKEKDMIDKLTLEDNETNVLPFKRSPISMPDSVIPTGNWLLDLPDGTVFLVQPMNDARNYNLAIRQKVQSIDTAAVLLVHPEQTMEWVDPARFINQWRFIRKVAVIENTDKREPPTVEEKEVT